MSRSTKYKLLYVIILTLLVLGSFAIFRATNNSFLVIVLMAIALLIPGRIQGHYWREFFRGRRILGQGDVKESIPHFVAFLEQVQTKPWLKKLVWLSWGMYTRDIEVMTLNNLSAAHLNLGELTAAETYIEKAIQLDPQAPHSWHNQGLIHKVLGDETLAEEAFAKAKSLGYIGDVSDQIVSKLGGALAKVEGLVP